ncbi:MAG: Lipid A export ATP-binding/permease protein MsbA [Chlamydiia bacterium]|nr:Lipid A export ATP-binding/permease protein MsbA [Chlamydiia bacterium]
MRLLLRAVFHGKRHTFLFLLTFVTLFGVTMATQLEMITLGVITNSGADAFKVFGNEDGNIDPESFSEKFTKIDKKHRGVITPEDTTAYLSKQKHKNPLSTVLVKFKHLLHMSGNGLKILVWMIFVVAIFKATTLFFSRFTTRLLAIRISKDLRERYFEHIQLLPMSFFQQHNIGSLSSRVVGDAHQISLSVNSWITNYLHTPFTLSTTLFYCFYLSWQLSLVIFVAVPLVIVPVLLVTRKVKQITRQLQKNQEGFAAVLIDYLAGIQTVKIFGMEAFSFKKYDEQNAKMQQLETRSAKYDLLTRPILHFITTCCLIFVFLFGLYILKVNLSELLVYCGLLHIAYEPIKKFADENANVQKGIVASERLFQVLHLKPEIEDHKDAKVLESFNESIRFDGVWFKYEDDWVLKDISFEVKKGETVAIVGATGAGKSTILQLLPRLYDVQKGDILIDGTSIREVTQKSLRDQVAYVSQRPFLFNDTIRANIAYGQDIPQDKIELAAERAHATGFINEMSETYDTLIAEMGKSLSGGQQQRLALARALIKNAPILILDEATSSLDSVSEEKVKQAILGLKGSVTQIIVAHRLSTIEHADRILFIQGGRLVAEGTKTDLYATCDAFKEMWDLNFRANQLYQHQLT